MADFDFDPAMFGLKADHGALNTKPAIDGPLPEASGGSGGSGALRGGHQGVRGRGDLTNSSLRGSRRGRGRGRGKGQSIRIGDDRGSGGHSQDHPTKVNIKAGYYKHCSLTESLTACKDGKS